MKNGISYETLNKETIKNIEQHQKENNLPVLTSNLKSGQKVILLNRLIKK